MTFERIKGLALYALAGLGLGDVINFVARKLIEVLA